MAHETSTNSDLTDQVVSSPPEKGNLAPRPSVIQFVDENQKVDTRPKCPVCNHKFSRLGSLRVNCLFDFRLTSKFDLITIIIIISCNIIVFTPFLISHLRFRLSSLFHSHFHKSLFFYHFPFQSQSVTDDLDLINFFVRFTCEFTQVKSPIGVSFAPRLSLNQETSPRMCGFTQETNLTSAVTVINVLPSRPLKKIT